MLETEPRRIATTVFRVINPTNKRQEFIPEVKLPEGWVLITKCFPFELNPNETDAKLVSFLVPQTALAGKYELTYVIKDRKHPSTRDFYTMYVIVLPVRKLQTKLLESPKYVIAGEEYQSSFAVTNQSNTECTVSTKVNSGDNIPWTVDAKKFKLCPGQSRTVVVSVKTDPKATKKLQHHLQFTAEVVQEDKAKVQSTATSIAEIIPRISGVEDRFHKIPAEVTLRYVSQKNNEDTSGLQTEIQGEGTLDEDGKKHIMFRFGGPDIQDKSIFAERDEYILSYWTKDYQFHFGDRSYSLSHLTENYLYGRGLEGRFNINDDFSLGAYYMKTRWLEPGTEETAAYIDYSINEKCKVGLNHLRKLRDGKVSNITSLEGELKPFKDIEVELEYASGPGGSKKDNAYLTSLYGHNDWLRYYFKLIHADPDYPGYYSDLDYISGGITLPIDKHIRLNTSFRQEKQNLDLDPMFYSAPFEKYYQLGIDYMWETNTTFSFDWFSRNRQDQLDIPKFDYREDSFRFGIGQDFNKLILHTSVELGKIKNKLDNATSDSERYTASVYFRPNNRQSYSGYLYYDKDSDFTGGNKRSTTVGLSTRYIITNRTFFNLAFQTNDYQGLAHGNIDNLELEVGHTFANGSKLSAVARHTKYRNSDMKDDTSLMVQYTIPLGLPITRKKSVGSIKGSVYDIETQDAIGNVILRLNGLTAVTNNAGSFTFPSVKPGIYCLDVDTASIGMDRVPTLKIPIKLAVRGGETTPVIVSVTQAALLLGQITVYGYQNSHSNAPLIQKPSSTVEPFYISENGSVSSEDANLIEDYGLANTVVELRDTSEIRRTVTDKQGRFKFEELRPGTWILKIYSDNLPEYHYLEKDTFELQLKPGQRKEICAKVLPKKRHIRIITEPQTLLEEQK